LIDAQGRDVQTLFSAEEHRFGVHAGDTETSMMLALRPERVRMDQAKYFLSKAQERAARFDILGNGKSAKLGWQMQDYNPEGAAGNAAAATPEKGQALLAASGRALAQLLAEIDPLPYEIRLAQAEARLRQNRAQLLTAKADLERVRQLHAQTLMSQQQLEAAQALVADREGAGAADQANVDDARRQLAYTRIEAPLSGRLGLRQVDAGNLIRPGDAGGIVVITQTRPINVLFTVPEQELPKVLEPLRAGQGLPVEAWDRAEQQRLAAGLLNTVDNQIDLATGTLRLKAEFPNDDEKLFPNQFVNVRLRVRTFKDAVVVPVAAIQYGSRGTYVYLVTEDSLAAVRDVVLGPAEEGMQAVLQGLSGGERVVLEGIDRLREGRPVTIVAADGTITPPPAGKGDKGGKGERGGKGGKGEKADQGGKGGKGDKAGQGEKSEGARKKAV
jgi:multidrug efflux system membrane fusion protein